MTKAFTDMTAPAVSVNEEDYFSAIVDVDPENVVDERVNEENNDYEKGLFVKGLLLDHPEELGLLKVCKPDNKARVVPLSTS